MDLLPDDIFIKIMRCNSHPCADMMNALFEPYSVAMMIQQKSGDRNFRAADQPSFFEWKVHGVGCKQWAYIMRKRREWLQKQDPGEIAEDYVHGQGRILSMVRALDLELAALQGLEYKR